jgi:hypothetical protein
MRKTVALIAIFLVFASGWTMMAQHVSNRKDTTASLKQQLMDNCIERDAVANAS